MFAAKNMLIGTPSGPTVTPFTIVSTDILVDGIPASGIFPLPTHAAGDLVVVYVHRNTAAVTTKPAAGGTVPTWIDIDSVGDAGKVESVRTCYFVATANNHTSGVWQQFSFTAVVVVRGQHTTPIGGHTTQTTASSTNSACAAPTLVNTDGTSLILSFHGAASTTNFGNAPANWTQIDEEAAASPNRVVVNQKNSSTSSALVTNTLSPAVKNTAAQIEIRQH